MSIIRFPVVGWHARYDADFTDDNVVRVAAALAHAWQREEGLGRLYVGFDLRHDAVRLAHLAGQVLAAAGHEVLVSREACPLPALEFALAQDPDAIGALMLSASEDPCEYGGIIARRSDGGPISDSFARTVDRFILADPIAERGEVTEVDLVAPYLDDLARLVDLDRIAQAHFRIVIDPMFGAASGHLFALLEKAGCSVTELHAGPSADFGGIHPEPVEPWVDECEQVVASQKASVGLVLDGDGDRSVLVDEKGRMVTPHNMVPLILGHLVRNRGVRGRVVTTLSSSTRLTRMADVLDLPVTSVPVGFGRISDEMQEGDVLLGAEEYGGVCLPAHLPERDGLLICLLALECMAMEGKSLSELVEDQVRELGRMDYIRKDIHIDRVDLQALNNLLPGLNPKRLAGKTPTSVSHSDGLRLGFSDDSWALIRPSRRGDTVRAYAEAPGIEARDRLLDAICEFARNPQM